MAQNTGLSSWRWSRPVQVTVGTLVLAASVLGSVGAAGASTTDPGSITVSPIMCIAGVGCASTPSDTVAPATTVAARKDPGKHAASNTHGLVVSTSAKAVGVLHRTAVDAKKTEKAAKNATKYKKSQLQISLNSTTLIDNSGSTWR